jgi:hypothetical protein
VVLKGIMMKRNNLKDKLKKVIGPVIPYIVDNSNALYCIETADDYTPPPNLGMFFQSMPISDEMQNMVKLYTNVLIQNGYTVGNDRFPAQYMAYLTLREIAKLTEEGNESPLEHVVSRMIVRLNPEEQLAS